MFELLKVNTMCGVCCVSMKVVVFIDLIATMILPASYCYAMYLLFLVFFQDLPVSTILLILYAIIMGVQVVVFILRSRWDYIWWFFIYFTIGLPVFYLVLPTYSFWNMDDFSWGKTRAVGGSAAANAAAGEDDDDEKKEFVEKDDMSHASERSGNSRSSRNSRRSTGSGGERSYASRDNSYASQSQRSGASRSYRSRDERSVGSASRSELDSRINF
jgi:chitin synthase